MNGQMSAYKEKQHIADSFIEKLQPYNKITPLQFDLRGYAQFLEENNISGKHVPENIVKRFSKTEG